MADAKTEKKPSTPPPPKVSYRELWRYADAKDKVDLVIAFWCACIMGVAQPFIGLLFGDILDVAGLDQQAMLDAINGLLIWFLVLGVVCAITSWVFQWFYTRVAERLAGRALDAYFGAVLRLDQEKLDTMDSMALPARILDDVNKVKRAQSEQLGMFVMNMAQFFGGFIMAFIYGPLLAGVLACTMPITAHSGYVMMGVMSKLLGESSGFHADAAAVCEESMTAVRTVVTFNGQANEVNRYSSLLAAARDAAAKSSAKGGAGLAYSMGFMMVLHGLAYYVGAQLIIDVEVNPNTNEPWTAGDVLKVFFMILMALMALGQAAPYGTIVTDARAAAAHMYGIIDATSTIENLDKPQLGDATKVTDTSVVLENVSFNYPSRPDIKVLENVSLRVEPGTTVALVGASGSGKSTTLALIERFYDASAGVVSVCGKPVKEWNVVDLRTVAGYIGQEPVLFDMSLAENVMYGWHKKSQFNEEQRKQMVEDALKQALAWEFVSKLKDGVNTWPGAAGNTISGGQKQRIAIARCLVRDVSLFLLDEATAALDYASERLVQETIDKVCGTDKSVIQIAHRLSTVRNSDKIYVFSEGHLVEEGTHTSLMEKQGDYYSLVRTQEMEMDAEDKEEGAGLGAAVVEQDNTVPTQKSGMSDGAQRKKSGMDPIVVTPDEQKVLDQLQKEKDKILKNTKLSPEDKEKKLKELEEKMRPLQVLLEEIEENQLMSAEEKEQKRSELIMARFKIPAKRLASYNSKERWLFPLALLGTCLTGAVQPMNAVVLTEGMGTTTYLYIASIRDYCLEPAQYSPPATEEVVFGCDTLENDCGKNICPYPLPYNYKQIPGWNDTNTEFGSVVAQMESLGPKSEWEDEAMQVVWNFGWVAVGTVVGFLLQESLFGYMGAALTKRIRVHVFEHMLKQEAGFFDRPQNTPGRLTTLLGTSAARIADAAGAQLGAKVSAMCSMVVGLGFAFNASPELTAVVLASMPAMGIVIGVVISVLLQGKKDSGVLKAGQIAAETIANMKTIRASTASADAHAHFNTALRNSINEAVTASWKGGAAFGMSNLVIFGVYTLGFWYGAILVEDGKIDITEMFQAVMGVIFAGMGAGMAFAFLPAAHKAFVAAYDIFTLLDRETRIDADAPGVELATFEKIELKKVTFAYPTRPLRILHGIDLTITKGMYVGLIGQTGSGKSSIIALLQRLYEPDDQSSIVISGKDKAGNDVSEPLAKLQLKSWRSLMGYVAQEPILFGDMGVLENIRYGNKDATDEQCKEAAQMAMVTDFIDGSEDMTRKLNWTEKVGPRGSKLSGGQRQRVAIARAAVRKPQLLLLDEATSALDAVSEEKVAKALKVAREGCTSIAIAHRLSTIRDADLIVGLSHGHVVECGNHEELIQKQGLYWTLLKKARG